MAFLFASMEVAEAGEIYESGVRLLTRKYPQYLKMPLDGRPLIVITPLEVTGWEASP